MGRRLGVVAAACLASAGLLLGGLAFVVLSMFPSEPAVEVRHGVAGAESDRWWRSYHLTLPDRVDELRWCQTRTWDLNEIYLRFGTDRAGLHALLGELGSPPARLHHVRRTRAFATAATNGWGTRRRSRSGAGVLTTGRTSAEAPSCTTGHAGSSRPR